MNKNTSCTDRASQWLHDIPEVVKFLRDGEIRTIQRALERLLVLNLVSQSGPTNAPKYDVLYGNLTHYG